MRKLIVIAAAVALASGLAAQVAVAAAPTVKVDLKEFKVLPSAKTAKAGKLTFAVKNIGKIDHELLVIKTNVAPGKLPVKNAQASVKGKVGEVKALKPGKSGKVTLTLAKGKYVLLCNLPGHYPAGQYTGFTVK